MAPVAAPPRAGGRPEQSGLRAGQGAWLRQRAIALDPQQA